jgi:EAL domain-containing protein (putative c-di-GMP-specific phosphodiesterase class I)
LGRIHELGYWVMDNAFPVLRNWQKQRRFWKNSINVSVAQFFQEDFQGKVLDILDKTKVDPKDLILEITESGEIPDSKIEKLNQILDVFRELGIKISHDDFGAGNSIDHLLRLRIDELKMDKSFWNSPNATKLLKMVATLSQDLGVRLVVEDVETKEQVEILMKLDIDVIVQGYYFSKPLSLQELENTYGKL